MSDGDLRAALLAVAQSIGGLPALNDGNNARAELYNRLIERYKVQMFISAGNSGPGLNTVGDPSVASRIVSVGAYVSKASHMANYGVETKLITTCTTFRRVGRARMPARGPKALRSKASVRISPSAWGRWVEGSVCR